MKTLFIAVAFLLAPVARAETIPDRATVQMARMKCDTVSGVATCKIKIPADARKINGGLAWFGNHHADDFIAVYITDEDNLLGYGAGFVVGGYTDAAVPEANRGWFIPTTAPYVSIERLVEFGTLPPNMWLKIVGTKGDGAADTLRINLHWGKLG